MKRFIFLCIPIILLSQEDDYKTLIDSAVFICAESEYNYFLETMKEDLSDDFKSDYKHNIENTYLFYEDNIPYYINNDNSKIKFKQIDLYDKKNRKILNKRPFGIKAWAIKPKLKGNELTIFIPEYNIKYENNS